MSCILSTNVPTLGAGCDAGAGIEPATSLKSAMARRPTPQGEVLIDARHYSAHLPASIAGVFYYSDADEPEKVEATKLYLALLRTYGLKEESLPLLSFGRNDSAVAIVDESQGAQDFLRRYFHERSFSRDRTRDGAPLVKNSPRLDVHSPEGMEREWMEDHGQGAQEWQEEEAEAEQAEGDCSETCVDVPPPSTWETPTCEGQLSKGLCEKPTHTLDFLMASYPLTTLRKQTIKGKMI